MEKFTKWPDAVRLKMIEKSEFYTEPRIYQYGFYDGYTLQSEQNAALYEALKDILNPDHDMESFKVALTNGRAALAKAVTIK